MQSPHKNQKPATALPACLLKNKFLKKAKTLTHLYNMVYGLFIMDLASLVVGDMEHYTPYTTRRSETHKKTSHYELP
jgi:hypothetical protein